MSEIKKQDQELREQTITDWKAMVQGLFVGPVPEQARWTKLPDIVRVLNVVGAKQHGNHMFLPGRGGIDLMKAVISQGEPGCIEVIAAMNFVFLVKPTELTLNWFGDKAAEWAYFRLEFAELTSCGADRCTVEDFRDDVTEVAPGEYVDQGVRTEGYYDDGNGRKIPLPETARDMTRFYFGSFVIFASWSTYNTGVTYDGRHNKMNAVQFREYIQKAIHKT